MAFRGSHSVREERLTNGFEGGMPEAAGLRQEYLERWRATEGRMDAAEIDDFVRRLATLSVCTGASLEHEIRAWKTAREIQGVKDTGASDLDRLRARLTRKIG